MSIRCNYPGCPGHVGKPYENPAGRWWGKCDTCYRVNRLAGECDGTFIGHASAIGPVGAVGYVKHTYSRSTMFTDEQLDWFRFVERLFWVMFILIAIIISSTLFCVFVGEIP